MSNLTDVLQNEDAGTVRGLVISGTPADNTVPKYDAGTGKIQSSDVTIDDSNNVLGMNNFLDFGNDTVTINFSSDADLTLSSTQNQYGYFNFTDTGVLLTAARSIIVSNTQRQLVVTNSTAKNLTVKTSAGTGVTIGVGKLESLYCDGTNVVVSSLASTNYVDKKADETTHTINFSSDTDLTLTTAQNEGKVISLTDTSVVLTTARNVIVDTTQKSRVIYNNTTQDLTVKTSAGTGIAVLAGTSRELYNDGTNVINTSLEVAKANLNASGAAPIYACRAWVNFNGTGTVAIRASGNVSSITDNGTGIHTVNLLIAIQDADYCAIASGSYQNAGTGNLAITLDAERTQTSSSAHIRCQNSAGLEDDLELVTLSIFR